MPGLPQPPDPALLSQLELAAARLGRDTGRALEHCTALEATFRERGQDVNEAREPDPDFIALVIMAATLREQMALVREVREKLDGYAITAETLPEIWADGYATREAEERAGMESRVLRVV